MLVMILVLLGAVLWTQVRSPPSDSGLTPSYHTDHMSSYNGGLPYSRSRSLAWWWCV